jgi:hypothetical protein
MLLTAHPVETTDRGPNSRYCSGTFEVVMIAIRDSSPVIGRPALANITCNTKHNARHAVPAPGCAAQGEALGVQRCWPSHAGVEAAGECPVHLGHRQRLCPCDGEPGLQGLDGQRRAPPRGSTTGTGEKPSWLAW